MRVLYEKAGALKIAYPDPLWLSLTKLAAEADRYLIDPPMPDGWQDYVAALVVDWVAGTVALDPTKVAAIDEARAVDAVQVNRAFRALVIWAAQRFGISAAQARSEILAIYKSLN